MSKQHIDCPLCKNGFWFHQSEEDQQTDHKLWCPNCGELLFWVAAQQSVQRIDVNKPPQPASVPSSSQPSHNGEKPTSETKNRSSAAEEAIDRQVEMWQAMGFTVGGVETAKEEARRATEARPNEAWFDEAVEKMVAIYCEHPQGFVRGSGGAPEQELRRIGEMLNQRGGMDLMLAAHKEFAIKCGVQGAPRNIESLWDCIGQWRG